MPPPDPLAPPPAQGGVLVQHRVPGFSENWVIVEAPVPEAAWHDRAVQSLRAQLEHWRARSGRDLGIFRNLAVRVSEANPAVGFDPDLLVVTPSPPDGLDLSSLKLWKAGHHVPSLVIEVVSPGHPYKDYSEIPDKCAALGVRELVVFDPMLMGPRALGGPQLLQLWRRSELGVFERVGTGSGPLWSAFLGAHLLADQALRLLRIAHDEAGAAPWPTAEEAALAARDAERAAKEAALARIAELERELSRREAGRE